ncbi:TIGR03089 family protein [Micromonosporaceae bacterium Da 78-11]
MTQGVARVGLDDLITYYDDATGERTSLSATQVGDWTAATAALLTSGCRLGPGSRAAVLLPPHWQTAAVLLGAWAAGLQVSFRGWSTAGLDPAGEFLDATFVERRRVGNWLDDVPAAGYQFVLGLGATDVPAGYLDYPLAVQPYLGSPAPSPQAATSMATDDGTTYGEYGELAAALAERHGIVRGDRLLIDVRDHEHPLTWLLAPLIAGASMVLCANLDPARRDELIAAERITRVL